MKYTIIRTIIENFNGLKVYLAKFPGEDFMAKVHLKKKEVYVSKRFIKTFNRLEQEAILFHELAHLELNHTGKRNINDEFEADRFAANRIGTEAVTSALFKTILHEKKCLNEGWITQEQYQPVVEEVSFRIQHLADSFLNKAKQTV